MQLPISACVARVNTRLDIPNKRASERATPEFTANSRIFEFDRIAGMRWPIFARISPLYPDYNGRVDEEAR